MSTRANQQLGQMGTLEQIGILGPMDVGASAWALGENGHQEKRAPEQMGFGQMSSLGKWVFGTNEHEGTMGQWMFGEMSILGQMGTLGPMSIGIGVSGSGCWGWDGEVGVLGSGMLGSGFGSDGAWVRGRGKLGSGGWGRGVGVGGQGGWGVGVGELKSRCWGWGFEVGVLGPGVWGVGGG